MTDVGGSVYENAPENSWADSTEDLLASGARRKPRRLTYAEGDVLQDRTNTTMAETNSVLKSKSSPRKTHSPSQQRCLHQHQGMNQEAGSGQRSRSLSIDRLRGAYEQSSAMQSNRRGFELKNEDVAEGWWEGVWDKVQRRARKATVVVSQASGKATAAVTQASKAIGSEVSMIREDLGSLTKDLSQELQKFNAGAQCFLARNDSPVRKWNRPDAVEWVCNLNRGEGAKLMRLGIEVAWDDNGPLIVSKIEKGCALDAWASCEQPVEVKLLPSNTVSVVHHLRVCPGDEIIAIDGVLVNQIMPSPEGRASLMKGLRQCHALTFHRRMKDPRRQALCRPHNIASAPSSPSRRKNENTKPDSKE